MPGWKAIFPLLLALALTGSLAAQEPVGELFAGGASVRGSVVLAASGASVLSGSQVSAGETAALLRLERGGELRICPRTSLSVSRSPAGHDLMIGFNAGSLELNYILAGGTDTVMTPDFRIQMIGPGTFHLAIAADASGTTCVRPLEGAGAGVIVSELLGSASYQVAPGAAVSFRGGQVANVSQGSAIPCGCPAPPPPPVRVAVNPEPAPPQPPPPEAPKLPPELHLRMETPMVYQGGSDAPPAVTASRLSVQGEAPATSKPELAPPPAPAAASASPEPAQPPAVQQSEHTPGFFRKVGRFFSRIFGTGKG